MAILATTIVQSNEAQEGTGAAPAPKTKRTTLTVAQRFANFKSALYEALDLSDEAKGVIETLIKKHSPAGKSGGSSSSGRGTFYQIFGEEPVVGTCVSPSQIIDLTDGKGALTEAMLNKWRTKGVPYGKGALADIRFYRRTVKQDGSVNEAFFKLESYTPAPEKAEGINQLND